MVAKQVPVQKVTPAHIDEAREALAVAEAELVRVREQFFNDQGATWTDVKEREGIVEFATAQIEKLARAEARYQAKVRLSAAVALHDEITTHAAGVGVKLAEQIREYWDARQGFLAAVEAHNATVDEFTARARALDVPAAGSRPVGFNRDGKMQLPSGGGVQAGRRVLDRVNGAQFLARLDEFGDVDGVAAGLAAIDAELPEPGERVHFRAPNGGVFSFDIERVPTADMVKRQGLIEITEAEAWGDE